MACRNPDFQIIAGDGQRAVVQRQRAVGRPHLTVAKPHRQLLPDFTDAARPLANDHAGNLAGDRGGIGARTVRVRKDVDVAQRRGFEIGRQLVKVAIGFPVIVDPIAGAIPDVKHPYYGPTEINYDGWIGYSRKLWTKYNWTVQLNVKNLGVGDKLIAVNAQPDGTLNSYRIAESQKWTLTSTVSF